MAEGESIIIRNLFGKFTGRVIILMTSSKLSLITIHLSFKGLNVSVPDLHRVVPNKMYLA